MKKFLLFTFFGIFLLFACKKHTTPSRVSNRLEKGPWIVAKFIDSTVNRTEEFIDVVFDFQEHRALQIFIPSGDTVSGSFDIPGNSKDPALLIIHIPEFALTQPVSDDWNVIFLSKDEFRLERLDGKKAEDDELIFRRL